MIAPLLVNCIHCRNDGVIVWCFVYIVTTTIARALFFILKLLLLYIIHMLVSSNMILGIIGDHNFSSTILWWCNMFSFLICEPIPISMKIFIDYFYIYVYSNMIYVYSIHINHVCYAYTVCYIHVYLNIHKFYMFDNNYCTFNPTENFLTFPKKFF